MANSRPQGPVLFELDPKETTSPALSPATAPPVPDVTSSGDPVATGQAMQMMARLSARPVSRLSKIFWATLVALLGFIASMAAWSFVTGLLTTYPVLGMVASVLFVILVLAGLGLAIREWAAYARLSRLDRLRSRAKAAQGDGDLGAARKVSDELLDLYKGRPALADARTKLKDRAAEAFDADAVFMIAEQTVMDPLDQRAREEVVAAARQVALVTALVPLALADVVTALTSNLRMIRRIAEVYGGRAGTWGSWKLTRTVLTHLVATGAVAVGDDLIGSFAGGGVLSKVSRRFGEGVVNGALTARVGVAAMEVCRPLPFTRDTRPSVSKLVSRSLTGLFGNK